MLGYRILLGSTARFDCSASSQYSSLGIYRGLQFHHIVAHLVQAPILLTLLQRVGACENLWDESAP
jgi:hypothetical protein